MNTIWKFIFDIQDEFRFDLDIEAKVLHVEDQFGRPCMWVLLDPDAPRKMREFKIRGTGQDFDAQGWAHVGTFQQAQGSLVWHLFEEVR